MRDQPSSGLYHVKLFATQSRRVPCCAGLATRRFHTVGETRTEFVAPASDRFVADDNPALEQQLFDSAQAELKPLLGAMKAADALVEEIKSFQFQSVVFSDRDAALGVINFATDLRHLAEPACGASLATAYLDHPALDGRKNVVLVILVVCGGVSVSPE